MTPEQRAKRLHYHIYETCEGIQEHAERIVKLEELLTEYIPMISYACDRETCPFYSECTAMDVCMAYKDATERMAKLGIEVR